MIDLWRSLTRLIFSWTLLTAVGGGLAYGLILNIASFLPEGLEPYYFIVVPGSALFGGLIAGSGQWFLMRTHLPISRWWIGATGLGWLLGIPFVIWISSLISLMMEEAADSLRLGGFLLGALAAGVIAAVGQWLLLRQHFQRHIWWLVGSGVGWLMAWILVLAVGLFLGGGEPLPTTLNRLPDGMTLGALAGFTVGFEQGIALIGLIAQTAWEKNRIGATRIRSDQHEP